MNITINIKLNKPELKDETIKDFLISLNNLTSNISNKQDNKEKVVLNKDLVKDTNLHRITDKYGITSFVDKKESE